MRPLFMGTASLMLMTYVSFLHFCLTYPGGPLIRIPTHICMHTIHEAAEIQKPPSQNETRTKGIGNTDGTARHTSRKHNPFSFFLLRKRGTVVQQRSWQAFLLKRDSICCRQAGSTFFYTQRVHCYPCQINMLAGEEEECGRKWRHTGRESGRKRNF